MRWTSPCYLRTPVDTPVRLLVVDLDARHSTVTSDLAEEEGIDVRTAVDAQGAISQCRLEYLDLVMINAGIDGESGVSLLEAIRTLRPTVRAVLMNGAQVPIRQVHPRVAQRAAPRPMFRRVPARRIASVRSADQRVALQALLARPSHSNRERSVTQIECVGHWWLTR